MDVEFLDHTDYSKVTSQLVKELYNYWKNKCFENHFPKFSDIQLNDIPNCKPYIETMEIHHNPLRIKYIHSGAEIARVDSDAKDNSWLHELVLPNIEKLAEFNAFKRIVRDRVPLFGIEEYYWLAGDEDVYEYGYFPFSDSGLLLIVC